MHLNRLDQEINDLLALRREDDDDSNRLLEDLHQRLLENGPKVPPRARDYERVIHAWSKEAATRQRARSPSSSSSSSSSSSLPAEAAERCTKLLNDAWMVFRNLPEPDPEITATYQPTRQMYRDTLRAWCHAAKRNPKSALQAESLLNEMFTLASNGNPHLLPSTKTVNIILYVFILALSVFLCSNIEFALSPVSWDFYLFACFPLPLHLRQCWRQAKSDKSVERSRYWLECMVNSVQCTDLADTTANTTSTNNTDSIPVLPDTASFNIVMRCILDAGGPKVAVECQKLVDQMKALSNSNAACSPDLDSYTLLTQAWARKSAAQAQTVVETLERARQEGSTSVVPNAQLYNTVLKAWSYSKQKNATKACQKALQNMEKLHQQDKERKLPTTLSYNIALNCLAKSGLDRAHHDAISLLDRMQNLYKNDGRDDCQPDVVSYTTCIDAMAKRGDAEKAEELLNALEDAYRTSGHSSALQPNVRTYTSVCATF